MTNTMEDQNANTLDDQELQNVIAKGISAAGLAKKLVIKAEKDNARVAQNMRKMRAERTSIYRRLHPELAPLADKVVFERATKDASFREELPRLRTDPGYLQQRIDAMTAASQVQQPSEEQQEEQKRHQEIQKFGLETVQARDAEDDLHGLLDAVIEYFNGLYSADWLNDPSEIACLCDQFEELQAKYRTKEREDLAYEFAARPEKRDWYKSVNPECAAFYDSVPLWPAPPEELRHSLDARWLPRKKKDWSYFRRSDWWKSYAADDGVSLDQKLALVRNYIQKHGFQVYQPEIPELLCPWPTSLVATSKPVTITPAEATRLTENSKSSPVYLPALLDSEEILRALEQKPTSSPAAIVKSVEHRLSVVDAAMRERGF